MIKSIMGIGFSDNKGIETAIFEDIELDYNWLSSNLPTSTEIAFLNKTNDSLEYHFSDSAYAYECVEYGKYKHIDKINIKGIFKSIRLSHADKIGKDAPLITTIDDKNDAEQFELKLNQMNRKELFETYTIKGQDLMIEDYCRGYSSCLAKKLKKIIVKNDNKIYTCMRGEPLCEVTDNLNVIALRDKLNKQAEKEYAKRGCENCEISEKCSKCLYVSHIGTDTDCNIMKNLHSKRNLRIINQVKNTEYFFRPYY